VPDILNSAKSKIFEVQFIDVVFVFSGVVEQRRQR
jgi:hypothetical protein